MKIKQVFLDAADHMERVGHVRGALYEDDSERESSACCAIGAIAVVTGPEYLHIYKVLRGRAHFLLNNLIQFSDSKGGTKETVVAELRRIAHSDIVKQLETGASLD